MKSNFKIITLLTLVVAGLFSWNWLRPEGPTLREKQQQAIEKNQADWGHWGARPEVFTGWTNHSNRMIPVYSFGIGLEPFTGENSAYRDESRLAEIYRRMPQETLEAEADYMDQTDIYRLQQQAIEQGKKFIILIVFDGMDWQTSQAAAIYRNRAVTYDQGRGNGLRFQDYQGVASDFGFMVTSPFNDSTKYDVNAQVVTGRNEQKFGGYNARVGGFHPWDIPASYPYLLGQDANYPHAYTDSASSATSMTSGIKTYNGAINVDPEGQPVTPIARQLQEIGFSTGIVTSVPFNHATPASAYANNVIRNDYQDLARDMLGLPSIVNRKPLPGLDVVLGCGWGINETTARDIKSEISSQGRNFVPGNKYIADDDLQKIDVAHGGKYQVVTRQAGRSGPDVLREAAASAVQGNHRLFGLFGTGEGHLPYATADGDFLPTRSKSKTEIYTPGDLAENPTLREMTEAALTVLERNPDGFWLLVEAGDVDWANHQNNIDNSIGAVFSGEAAFEAVCQWAEKNDRWKDTAVILTADHGHLFVLDQPQALIPASPSWIPHH